MKTKYKLWKSMSEKNVGKITKIRKKLSSRDWSKEDNFQVSGYNLKKNKGGVNFFVAKFCVFRKSRLKFARVV